MFGHLRALIGFCFNIEISFFQSRVSVMGDDICKIYVRQAKLGNMSRYAKWVTGFNTSKTSLPHFPIIKQKYVQLGFVFGASEDEF